MNILKKYRLCFLLISSFFFLFVASTVSLAQEIPSEWRMNMRMKHEYKHFTLPLNWDSYSYFFLQKPSEQTASAKTFNDPYANDFFCPDETGESSEELTSAEIANNNEVNTVEWDVDPQAIKTFLEENVVPSINREPTSVVISRDEVGNIIFDGHADFGEEVDIAASTLLIQEAIRNGLSQVTLAVKKTNPVLDVQDEELRERGIQDLLSVGQSYFDGSPVNRRHNIAVGAARFNGVLIPQGEEFSFNTQLGPVDGSTGYRKELVIVGPKTIPEYGGGLCQVSSTFYRGAMLAGVEITERKNHSYSVIYYFPEGSDATIYPGVADVRFLNNTPGDILLQTRIEGDELFYHYYGRRDERQVSLFGPYTYNYRAAPAPRYTTSTDMPPGTQQQVSGVHPGFDAMWYRLIRNPIAVATDAEEAGEEIASANPIAHASAEEEVVSAKEQPPEEVWESYFSRYQARGLWIVTGVTAEEAAQAEQEAAVAAPAADGSWIEG